MPTIEISLHSSFTYTWIHTLAWTQEKFLFSCQHSYPTIVRLVEMRASAEKGHSATEGSLQEQLVGVNGCWTSQPGPILYCVFSSWEGGRPLTASGVQGSRGVAAGSGRQRAGERRAGSATKMNSAAGSGGGLKSAKMGHKLPRGSDKGLCSSAAYNLLTTAIWIKRTIGQGWRMNNSYRKVDEIQVRAKHARLMYVIYICALTPLSALDYGVVTAATAPSTPVRRHETFFCAQWA